MRKPKTVDQALGQFHTAMNNLQEIANNSAEDVEYHKEALAAATRENERANSVLGKLKDLVGGS